MKRNRELGKEKIGVKKQWGISIANFKIGKTDKTEKGTVSLKIYVTAEGTVD